jgi:GMP synthase-like glutamine amidotransferase
VKSVAILRHAAADGPGYFAEHLSSRGIPQTLVHVDLGEAPPTDPTAFAGIALMGGPMSVNDSLPWIAPELALIRAAIAADVPVIGHCLGGQLISKALGGEVTRNAVKEIGWGPIQIAPTPLAQHWFGLCREFLSFHWHGETFAIPPGAERIASSAYCMNQAFALGKHLGMQCHVEMTPDMIRAWASTGGAEISASAGPSVQSPVAMQARIDEHSRALSVVAAGLYDRWIEGLAR